VARAHLGCRLPLYEVGAVAACVLCFQLFHFLELCRAAAARWQQQHLTATTRTMRSRLRFVACLCRSVQLLAMVRGIAVLFQGGRLAALNRDKYAIEMTRRKQNALQAPHSAIPSGLHVPVTFRVQQRLLVSASPHAKKVCEGRRVRGTEELLRQVNGGRRATKETVKVPLSQHSVLVNVGVKSRSMHQLFRMLCCTQPANMPPRNSPDQYLSRKRKHKEN
jgi:hypothetical protein